MHADSDRETQTLEQVTEGMSVVDANGEHLGNVDALKMGDPEAATTEGNEPITGTPGVGVTPVLGVTPLSTITEPDIPEPRRSQLLRLGYIRVDGGPLSHHAYYSADEIASVRDDTVYLAPSATEPNGRPSTPPEAAAEPARRTGPPPPIRTTYTPPPPAPVDWRASETSYEEPASSDMSGALKSFGVGSAIGVTLAGSSLVAYRWWRRRRRPQNRLQRRLHHLREQMPDPSALLDHAPEVDLDARKGGGLGAAALALAGLVWLLRQRMGSETPLESLPMIEPEPTMQASHGLGPWVWLAASLASLGLGAALAWLFQRGANQPTHVGTQRVDSDLASDQHARR